MASSPITILDGGMGRELHRIGAPFRQPEWSALSLLEAPEFVKKAHLSYIRAGAHVITANNYAVVPYHLGQERFHAQGGQLAHRAGSLGRQAILESRTPFVRLAGSLPPVGGSYRPDLFKAEDSEEILSLLVSNLSPFVDLWIAETQSSIEEACAARRSIPLNDPRPFWLSFTLDDTQQPTTSQHREVIHLRSGEALTDAVNAAIHLKVDALLFNCCDPSIMLPALQNARDILNHHAVSSEIQLGVYANAFDTHHASHHDEANEVISALDPSLTTIRYSTLARQWKDAGAQIIGGCCGIGPEYITELAHRL